MRTPAPSAVKNAAAAITTSSPSPASISPANAIPAGGGHQPGLRAEPRPGAAG